MKVLANLFIVRHRELLKLLVPEQDVRPNRIPQLKLQLYPFFGSTLTSACGAFAIRHDFSK
jgi:hypothetical protein